METEMVYVVGEYPVTHGQWVLHGIYTNETEAVAACISKHHFIGPVVLNTTFPQPMTKWPNLYYPNIP